MVHALLKRLMLGASLVAAGSVPALVLSPAAVYAQVSASPSAVEISVPAGQQGEVLLAVTNAGGAAVELLAAPLPEGEAPADVGEQLFATEPGAVGDPYGLTMTAGGRIFVARPSGSKGLTTVTWELSPELDSLRLFVHPVVDQRSGTLGVAWMPPERAPPGYPDGTLWWMDLVVDCDGPDCTVESTLLIEGDLDGNPTGRTVELVTGPAYTGPGITYDRGVPNGLAYDANAASGDGLFYYVDAVNEDLYAIGVDGEVAEGYPVPQTDYDPGGQLSMLQAGIDAVRGHDGGAYFETAFALEGEGAYGGVVVTDRWGTNTGVETPLSLLEPPDGQGAVVQIYDVVRSRVDPSVLYVTLLTQRDDGTSGWVVAIRAHPLPPRWLRVAPVAPASLALAPGGTDTVAVRFDAEGLAPGVYEGQVAFREGGPNGEEAVAVPVVLTVTKGTATEDEAAPDETRLSVYPNPTAGAATVALTLAEAANVRVAAFDVLGREVAVLHDGLLTRGKHHITLNGSALPAGLYVIRAAGSGIGTARGVTVMR